MIKRINLLLLAILSPLLLAGCMNQSKAINIPERPPTFDELMVLADKNLAQDSLIKGYIYSQEEGVGFQNIMALAQTGDTEAEVMACYLLVSGIGVKKDEALGYPLCEKAAEKGSGPAKANLIYRDFNNDPENMNWQETYDAFYNLIDIAPGKAHRGLQFLYRKDHPNASMPMMFYHLKQAIKHKNTSAMHAMSEFDLRIRPEELRNPVRAEKNLTKAYTLNDFDAGFALALEYREGRTLVQDTEKYASMIKHMAAFLHPNSMGELAYMYETGRGVAKDDAKAITLFMQAAKLGDSYSQKKIAYHFLFGPIDSRNYEAGVQYFEEQAQKGDVESMRTLFNHYARSEIDDPENKRVMWLSNAAMRGDTVSQEILGMNMMESGYIESIQPYIQLLEFAHEAGSLDASYLLARHYRGASGVRRDLAKAQLILSKVAHLNDPRVIQEIDIVEGYISHFGGIDAVPAIIKN